MVIGLPGSHEVAVVWCFSGCRVICGFSWAASSWMRKGLMQDPWDWDGPPVLIDSGWAMQEPKCDFVLATSWAGEGLCCLEGGLVGQPRRANLWSGGWSWRNILIRTSVSLNFWLIVDKMRGNHPIWGTSWCSLRLPTCKMLKFQSSSSCCSCFLFCFAFWQELLCGFYFGRGWIERAEYVLYDRVVLFGRLSSGFLGIEVLVLWCLFSPFWLLLTFL